MLNFGDHEDASRQPGVEFLARARTLINAGDAIAILRARIEALETELAAEQQRSAAHGTRTAERRVRACGLIHELLHHLGAASMCLQVSACRASLQYNSMKSSDR